MKVQVYRATRNILPNQICEFYNPAEPSYKHGNGMYFAFKKSYSEQFVSRSSGYAILGQFQIEVGDVIHHDGDKYLVAPESELGKLQALYIKVKEEANTIYDTFGIQNVQNHPEYNLANAARQTELMYETIAINDEIEKRLESTPEWERYHNLKKLAHQIFVKFDEELFKVDAVVCNDSTGSWSGELALKKDLPIDLLSFDLYCSESVAQKIFEEIKVGEISNQGLMNIPGEHATVVSKILATNS